MNTPKKIVSLQARARRTHAKARMSGKPRLVVFRSNRTIYAQIVDDATKKILCGTSGLKLKSTGTKSAEEVGTNIAKLAQEKKVKSVTFDRNGYKYHGQVKTLADSARTGGLVF